MIVRPHKDQCDSKLMKTQPDTGATLSLVTQTLIARLP